MCLICIDNNDLYMHYKYYIGRWKSHGAGENPIIESSPPGENSIKFYIEFSPAGEDYRGWKFYITPGSNRTNTVYA